MLHSNEWVRFDDPVPKKRSPVQVGRQEASGIDGKLGIQHLNCCDASFLATMQESSLSGSALGHVSFKAVRTCTSMLPTEAGWTGTSARVRLWPYVGSSRLCTWPASAFTEGKSNTRVPGSRRLTDAEMALASSTAERESKLPAAKKPSGPGHNTLAENTDLTSC